MALTIYRVVLADNQTKTIAAPSLAGAINYCERRPDWNIVAYERLVTAIRDDDTAKAILEEGADFVVDDTGAVIGQRTFNQYSCPCGTEWDDIWDHAGDDCCPQCHEITPPVRSFYERV